MAAGKYPSFSSQTRHLLDFHTDNSCRGIGAEIARKFANEGCNIAINYVSSEAPAQALSKELQDKHNVKTTVIQGDGGVVADIQNCVQQTIKAFGGIDIIIGNAGVRVRLSATSCV